MAFSKLKAKRDVSYTFNIPIGIPAGEESRTY